MNKKKSLITIIIFGALLGIFTIADICTKDRIFSENENRVLAAKPDFTGNTILSGQYSEDYENYVTDQFAWRDMWISLKTRSDIALGKKDINGIYLADDNYLIEKHSPTMFSTEDIDKKYLSGVIFSDKEIKMKVEEYLHSRIYQKIVDWIDENENERLLFVEVPLLYEVNWNKRFDCNVTVSSNIDLIYKRLLEKRNMSKEDVDKRLINQMSPEKKVALADYVLENASTLEKLFSNIEVLIKKLDY